MNTTRKNKFYRFISQVLLVVLLCEPVLFAAGKSDKNWDKTAKDFQKDLDQTKKGEKDAKITQSHDDHGNEHVHAEFRDKSGNVREYDFDRSVVHGYTSGERSFAMRESRSVSVRDIPGPRSTDFKSDLGKQSKEFDQDQSKIRDFEGSLRSAITEKSKEAKADRRRLDIASAMLSAATSDGSRITRDLSDRLHNERAENDAAQKEASPPALTDMKVSIDIPQFLPPIDFDAPQKKLKKDLERVAKEIPSETATSASNGAIENSTAQEVVDAQPELELENRLMSFVGAYKETIRAGAELTIDLALGAFPVVSLGWGVANLVSAAKTGKTILGSPVETNLDFALVTLGAVVPALAMPKVMALMKRFPLPVVFKAKHAAKLNKAILTLPKCLSVQRIRNGTNSKKIAIIGRSMSNPKKGLVGVEDAAAHFKTKGIEVEIFAEKGANGSEPIAGFDAAKKEFFNLVEQYAEKNGGAHLPDELVKETALFQKQKEWIQKLIDEGYTVIDIGNPNNLSNPSIFYTTETVRLFPN